MFFFITVAVVMCLFPAIETLTKTYIFECAERSPDLWASKYWLKSHKPLSYLIDLIFSICSASECSSEITFLLYKYYNPFGIVFFKILTEILIRTVPHLYWIKVMPLWYDVFPLSRPYLAEFCGIYLSSRLALWPGFSILCIS